MNTTGNLKLAATLMLSVQLIAATQWATQANAAMIGTETAIERYAADASRAQLLDDVRKDEVRREMVALGVDPSEAEARLAAMSDAEVAEMLTQMDEGSAGAGVVGTLATIFIILLVTDLLCFTRFFNFTRCVR